MNYRRKEIKALIASSNTYLVFIYLVFSFVQDKAARSEGTNETSSIRNPIHPILLSVEIFGVTSSIRSLCLRHLNFSSSALIHQKCGKIKIFKNQRVRKSSTWGGSLIWSFFDWSFYDWSRVIWYLIFSTNDLWNTLNEND